MLLSFAACSKQDAKKTDETKKAKTTTSTTQKAEKSITIEVIGKDNKKKEFKIETKEKFLRGALEQEKLVEGEEGDYGLFVKTVDGYKVDDAKKEWWCFSKNGKDCQKGVDETKINDGDTIGITLKTY